jgi:zinc transporter 1/2/3
MISGGVFLATGLCHLLPDAAEAFEGMYNDFPFPYMLTGLGFMATLFIEQISHALVHSRPSKDVSDAIPLLTSGINENIPEDPSSIVVSQPPESVLFPSEVESQLTEPALALLKQHYNDYVKGVNKFVSSSNDVPVPDGHSHGIPDTEGTGMLMVIAIWVALSFHSIMVGLVLGAAEDKVTSIFIAIMAHKGLEAFALGTSIVRSTASMKKYAAFCIAFASMTPIGILIGMIIEHFSEDSLISAAVSSIACGTFLYVGICEVILNELNRPHDKVLKCALLLVGFGLMAMLAIWV